jgi:uncharacterized protein (TIGR00251 family)
VRVAAERRSGRLANVLAIQEHPDGLSIRVRVIPKGRRNQVVGVEAGILVVRVAAPPVEGQANEALLEFLAQRLGVRTRALQLQSGQRSRHKVVKLEGVQRAAIEALASPEAEE